MYSDRLESLLSHDVSMSAMLHSFTRVNDENPPSAPLSAWNSPNVSLSGCDKSAASAEFESDRHSDKSKHSGYSLRNRNTSAKKNSAAYRNACAISGFRGKSADEKVVTASNNKRVDDIGDILTMDTVVLNLSTQIDDAVDSLVEKSGDNFR